MFSDQSDLTGFVRRFDVRLTITNPEPLAGIGMEQAAVLPVVLFNLSSLPVVPHILNPSGPPHDMVAGSIQCVWRYPVYASMNVSTSMYLIRDKRRDEWLMSRR